MFNRRKDFVNIEKIENHSRPSKQVSKQTSAIIGLEEWLFFG